jgi:hypothetical protein
MRYHYDKPAIYLSKYGETHKCNHPIYNECTLFKIGNKGLAVIQQRFDPIQKHTYWSKIDPWLTDEIYLHSEFKNFFENRSGECKNNIYPTVTIRQVMWGLRMKPMTRERWETYFDRKII